MAIHLILGDGTQTENQSHTPTRNETKGRYAEEGIWFSAPHSLEGHEPEISGFERKNTLYNWAWANQTSGALPKCS